MSSCHNAYSKDISVFLSNDCSNISVSVSSVSSCPVAYSAFLLLLISSVSSVFLVARMLMIRISCLCIGYASSCPMFVVKISVFV